jgi:hypothetical protein
MLHVEPEWRARPPFKWCFSREGMPAHSCRHAGSGASRNLAFSRHSGSDENHAAPERPVVYVVPGSVPMPMALVALATRR